MHFYEAFDKFRAKCGLDVPSLMDGDNTILFDDQHAVTFQCDKADKSVILSSEICDAVGLGDNDLQMLLEASLFGAQTGGASFALSRQLSKVILWKRQDDSFIDEQALAQVINGFLATVITWKQRLAGGNGENTHVYAGKGLLA